MKIGIFGGTFNPIHNSHIYIAEEFREKLGLERMLIVPTYTPPHKTAEGVADPAHRLAMCRLAIRDLPGFSVSEYEIGNEDKSYTYKTLHHLWEQNPGAELYLIMGSDMFLTVQSWKKPEEIYKMAVLCAAQREHDGLALMSTHKKVLERHGARCMLIDITARPLSSTLIRDMIRIGEDPSSMVHPDVWAYIRHNRLYQEERSFMDAGEKNA